MITYELECLDNSRYKKGEEDELTVFGVKSVKKAEPKVDRRALSMQIDALLDDIPYFDVMAILEAVKMQHVIDVMNLQREGLKRLD